MDAIARYYASKLQRFGACPLGVDWSCEPSQHFRFIKLMQVCRSDSAFSLNDIGCGYGALLEFLGCYYADRDIDYHGVDICDAMVVAARNQWIAKPSAAFSIGDEAPDLADYSVASGIFNVRLDFDDEVWGRHVADCLAKIARRTRKGFAVNFVDATGYSKHVKAGLYRVEPEHWARFCTEALGCSTEIVTDYGMREFTLLARLNAAPDRDAPALPAAKD